jgi:hypothetical protein
MEEKYSSQDVNETLQRLGSTLPVVIQTPEPNELKVPAPPVPPVVVVAAPAAQSTPSKKENTGGGISPEFGSPLTEESWELLDQLEMEATQRLATEVRTSQVDSSSSPSQTLLALTPRPMPPSPALPKAAVGRGEAPAPKSEPVEPSRGGTGSPSLGKEGYARYVVLEVDRDFFNRVLILRLVDESDRHLEALLTDAWFDTTVEAGDTVNIIFTVQDPDGYFSPVVGPQHAGNISQRIKIDNDRNAVVVHPDILVRSTSRTSTG